MDVGVDAGVDVGMGVDVDKDVDVDADVDVDFDLKTHIVLLGSGHTSNIFVGEMPRVQGNPSDAAKS